MYSMQTACSHTYVQVKKKLCKHNIYHSRQPNKLKAGEPKLLLLGCGWMCISSTVLLPFKAILRLLSLCPAKIKHTHMHTRMHADTRACTHTHTKGWGEQQCSWLTKVTLQSARKMLPVPSHFNIQCMHTQLWLWTQQNYLAHMVIAAAG